MGGTCSDSGAEPVVVAPRHTNPHRSPTDPSLHEDHPTVWENGALANLSSTTPKPRVKEKPQAPFQRSVSPSNNQVIDDESRLDFETRLAEEFLTPLDVMLYTPSDVDELLKDVLGYNVIIRNKLKRYMAWLKEGAEENKPKLSKKLPTQSKEPRNRAKRPKVEPEEHIAHDNPTLKDHDNERKSFRERTRPVSPGSQTSRVSASSRRSKSTTTSSRTSNRYNPGHSRRDRDDAAGQLRRKQQKEEMLEEARDLERARPNESPHRRKQERDERSKTTDDYRSHSI